jgi:hypothetical protein
MCGPDMGMLMRWGAELPIQNNSVSGERLCSSAAENAHIQVC